MDHDELREHIESATGGTQLRQLTSRMFASCWPGGSQDRTERVAAQWLRRWRPEKAGAVLPACSCLSGHCPVCN
jgi:hypothetical protein